MTVELVTEVVAFGLSGVLVAVAEGTVLVAGLDVALLEEEEEEFAGRVLGEVVVAAGLVVVAEVAGLVVVVEAAGLEVVVVVVVVVGRELLGVT